MDATTISSIVAVAVGFLSSYFTSFGKSFGEKTGEGIYQAIRSKIGQKPAAQEALADLEVAPEDADTQAALRVQLRKVLSEDNTFALELQKLLKRESTTEQGATIIRQIAGDNANQIGQVFGDVTFR